MDNGQKGVLLRIELGLHRPTRAEVQRRIEKLANQLKPQAVIAGMRRFDDVVEVAIMEEARYREALRQGPEALRKMLPWDEADEARASEFL